MTDAKIDISEMDHVVGIENEVKTTINLKDLFLSECYFFIRRDKIVLFFRMFLNQLIFIIDIFLFETYRRG